MEDEMLHKFQQRKNLIAQTKKLQIKSENQAYTKDIASANLEKSNAQKVCLKLLLCSLANQKKYFLTIVPIRHYVIYFNTGAHGSQLQEFRISCEFYCINCMLEACSCILLYFHVCLDYF